MKFDLPAGRMPIEAPKPFRVEYPYGKPGDDFRTLAREGKTTCVAYHKGVDPVQLSGIEQGNLYRYGPGDERYETLKASMQQDGFIGGDAQRIIIHVDENRSWVAEGNHRLRVALEVEVPAVEIEVRYLNRCDEDFLLIPFDFNDPEIRVISD